ncbi:MAG: diacylglycerol kinase [Halofilum sp. (in: g-proteobacteria)]|nr:diacylglycerol kinase [Halofilum sp. (in: g-proteobacteria)]
MKPGYTGIKRLVHAAKFSMQGLAACFRHESAFRQETALMVVAIPLGLWLGENGLERAVLVAVVLLIPIVELLNTGVEYVVDRFGSEMNDLSGRAKDVGSAAVLLSIILAIVVWVLILTG